MFSLFSKQKNEEQIRSLIERRFEPSLFNSEEHQYQFNKYGFVHLKNILTVKEIETLVNLYHSAIKIEGFQKSDYYINSIGFKDKNIRLYLKENTEQILKSILPRFINTNQADFPLSGGYCINPANATKGCEPHQDPTCIDEIQSYSMTVWISISDMTPENGCMNIIPGSHLWGNVHRSICVPWAFEKLSNYLWKYLKPIPTKSGDILCFDVSTIHASTANKTENTRLAMTVQTIPKNHNLITYFPINDKKVASYSIDRDYFIQESQYQKPSKKYKKIKEVKLDNTFTEKNIDELYLSFNAAIKENEII